MPTPTASPARANAAARLERLPFSGYHKLIFIIVAIAFSSTRSISPP